MSLGLSMYALNNNDWNNINDDEEGLDDFRELRLETKDGRSCCPDYVWDVLGFLLTDVGLLSNDDSLESEDCTTLQHKDRVKLISQSLQTITLDAF